MAFLSCCLYIVFNIYSSIAVIGSGLMGAGIAQVTVNKKIPCVMKDVNESGLQRGLAQIQKNFATAVKRKQLST